MSKKSALLIGCNYLGSALSTDGCIASVHNFENFLKQRLYVLDTLILCDAGESIRPTKNNILTYFQNLMNSASKGDVLFFVYCGASQKLSKDALIVPCDYLQNGYLSGEEFRNLLDDVPEGVTLCCISDSTYASVPISLRYEVTDISTGNLSVKQLVANNRKIPNFKDYTSKQTVLENIPVHETIGAVLFLFGVGEEKNGYLLWSLMQTLERMHMHGIQLNHMLTRMQATLRLNDDYTQLKLFFGQFMELNVTFGRFVAGNI
jgi:hypothetical protein